ncbi:MAG: GNAT family protein [Phycisphaerales bacterium]
MTVPAPAASTAPNPPTAAAPPPSDAPAPPAPWTPPTPLPGPVHSPRVTLRFWEAADAPSMLAAIEASRSTLLPWMPWALADNRTVEECIYNIERFRRAREAPACDSYVLGIFDRRTNEAIGGTGLHRINHSAQQAEIGYWVRADRRRRGLCTEAVAHLLSAALAPQAAGGWGFRRIEILCGGGNTPSARVPGKLGLRQEYSLKEARWVDGLGWQDTLGWGVLAGEWDGARHALRRG